MTHIDLTIPSIADRTRLDCDVLVIGGGTAGTMAALSAAGEGARVLILEKAHVRHSGALAMGMDGVNNAVIPGKADPDTYVADVTRANDGIVNQRTVRQTATRGFEMVQRLERYGVKFEKDEYGEYAVRKVHRSGSYVLPMPEGKDVKKVLYRVLRERSMRDLIRIENRVMPVRVLTADGRAVGAAGFDTRTGAFVTVSAGAVILATGASGRLGLPASGYLYGTYENPTNAGDGHSMAYHAGAELSGIECFQINPLIKDYNGPACAYVANPFGGYQVNSRGERFVDCDYWSGRMMAEVAREIESARGPVYLKVSHLPETTIQALEGILHTTERPTRGTFHANRGHDYRTHDIEMHISEIGLCGGHSGSGVWVDENAATTVPGLYAAGDLACVPHNYMIGAFVFGDLAGRHAAQLVRTTGATTGELPEDQVAAAHDLIYRPLRNPDGPPQPQVEYKLRRFVNDYVAPPKTGRKLAIAVETFERMGAEVASMGARTPHELMRCAEVGFILDCAMMAAQSSLVRTESRWGLYHERADIPEQDDAGWLDHLNLRKSPDDRMEFLRRPVAAYLVPVEEFEPQPDRPVRFLGPVVSGLDVARAGSFAEAPVSVPRHEAHADRVCVGQPSGARILDLLALAEEEPGSDQLAEYLADPAPDVRRAAVSVLTETAPPEAGPLLTTLLADQEPSVRRAAADGLTELVEVLVPEAELVSALTASLQLPDPYVRAAVVDLLRALRAGDRSLFSATLHDEQAQVRAAAVHALVSLDAHEALAAAVADPDRDVRIAAAKGLGTIGNPGSAELLGRLARDSDYLVRAAALEAAPAFVAEPALATAVFEAVEHEAWQVRKGAATALSGLTSDSSFEPAATEALVLLLKDDQADVRKAAVVSLTPRAGRPDVDRALAEVADDSDADVRAYVRRLVPSR